jgi:hypothetical protein
MNHKNYFCDEMGVFVSKMFLRAEFGRCFLSNLEVFAPPPSDFRTEGNSESIPRFWRHCRFAPCSAHLRHATLPPNAILESATAKYELLHQINDIVMLHRAAGLLSQSEDV